MRSWLVCLRNSKKAAGKEKVPGNKDERILGAQIWRKTSLVMDLVCQGREIVSMIVFSKYQLAHILLALIGF